jgi:hypothetical protein
MQPVAGQPDSVTDRATSVPAQLQARRRRDGLRYLRHGEMVRPELSRELTLAEAAEAEVEFPHREGAAEQWHVLPPQPLNGVHDRAAGAR